jgi:hypothetical protein
MKAGLCAICMHRREIRSKRGSSFLLCRRSLTDPRFRRYPPLPVLRCPGFEPGDPDPGRDEGDEGEDRGRAGSEDEAPGGADVR